MEEHRRLDEVLFPSPSLGANALLEGRDALAAQCREILRSGRDDFEVSFLLARRRLRGQLG